MRILVCATACCSTAFAFVCVSSTLQRRNLRPTQDSILFEARTNTTIEASLATRENPDDKQQDKLAALLSRGDPTVDAPLPPAYTACPFSGIVGGPQSFYRIASQALKAPNLFSFVHKNQPMIEVSGGAHVHELLNQEFTTLKSNAVAGVSQIACGTSSLRTAQDRRQHRSLRDLVGLPLSAPAVTASIPRLQAICQESIDKWIHSRPKGSVLPAIAMTQFMALEVTWQQVLGLNLSTQQEKDMFHSQTTQWLRGMYSRPETPEFQAMLQAREYLVQAMEHKIQNLQQAGESDGSTVGDLLYATLPDEEGVQNQTLTTQQVIDNALLLILAATETTSSNLANSIMLMGVHADVWKKVVQEQETVVCRHGETITKDILDNHIPYLEAVIQETLRILPVTLVSRREAGETILIDRQQIPQGWAVSYNIFLTHQRDESVRATARDVGQDPMDLWTGFRPSRWLDSETRPNGKNYIPFGAGPRKCPGILLAKSEMKTFLAIFARSVSYELANVIDTSKPIDEQIVWKQLNPVPIPEHGVEIRVL